MNRYRALGMADLPTVRVCPVLWTRRGGDYKLRLCATVHSAMWGQLRGQLPSGAEGAMNWSIVLRSR